MFISSFFLINQIIKKRFINLKQKNLHIIFIYFNLIIIYLILFHLYHNNTKKLKTIKIAGNDNATSNAFYLNNLKKFEDIIQRYKRTSIIWPLPSEIKFRPLMTNNEIFKLIKKKKNETRTLLHQIRK